MALSKAKAGTLSYTAPSPPLMLYLEKLKRERGADWVGIPFRGGGETTNAVLSGSTPIAFLGLQNFISHLQAGTMRGLATDGAERTPLFPEMPTLAELGYRGNLTRVYFGLVAPAGTPKPIIDRIRADVAGIAGDTGVPAEAVRRPRAGADPGHARAVRALPRRQPRRPPSAWLRRRACSRSSRFSLRHLEQDLRQPVRHVDHHVVAARHLVDAPARRSL